MKLRDFAPLLQNAARLLARSFALVAIGIVFLALLGTLVGCGGGHADDPEQRKNEPSPNCAMRPESCK
jgi:hypothetical protein